MNIHFIIAGVCVSVSLLLIIMGGLIELQAVFSFDATLEKKLGYFAFRRQIRQSSFSRQYRTGFWTRAVGLISFGVFALWFSFVAR